MEVYKSTRTAKELDYALGAVPSIGENGNWWIGDVDTGIFAKGINVTGAEVGQTVKISAVDENGVPTAWEAADLAGGVLRRVGRIQLAEGEMCKVVEISNLNVKAPFTLRMGNVANSNVATGITIKLNGVSSGHSYGSIGGDGFYAGAMMWVFNVDDKLNGKGWVGTAANTSCSWNLPARQTINSVGITTWYVESDTTGEKYFGEGFWLEVWEGVHPNAK